MIRETRHQIDRIARAVVSGRRGLGKRADGIADAAATLVRSRLEAVGAPGDTGGAEALLLGGVRPTADVDFEWVLKSRSVVSTERIEGGDR